jgi:hypothetical protein
MFLARIPTLKLRSCYAPMTSQRRLSSSQIPAQIQSSKEASSPLAEGAVVWHRNCHDILAPARFPVQTSHSDAAMPEKMARAKIFFRGG